MTELEDRVSKLEDQHEITNRDVNELKTDVGVFNILLKQVGEALTDISSTIKENSNTMTEVRLTMKEMQGEIKFHTTQMQEMKNSIDNVKNEMKESIDEIKNDMESVKTEVKEVDEKGKIDWMKIMKEWIVKLLAGGGIVYLIIELLK